MFGSPARSKDLELSFAYNRKEESGGDLQREMNSQQQQQQGLLRYRSAPSSLFGEVCDDFLPAASRPPSSPDPAETMIARFLSSAQVSSQFPPPQSPASQHHHHLQQHQQQQQQQQQLLYQQQQQQQQINSSQPMSIEAEQMKNGGLIRHSSSPAGLFSHLNIENGYGLMRSMSGMRNGNGTTGSEGGGRLKGQLSFSSRQGSLMSQISEDGSSPEDNSAGGGRCYMPGYPIRSWEDSQVMPDNFSSMKRARENGLNQSESQNGDVRNNGKGLTHQFSLPKTSSEMAAIEKFLQFQDAVPCKVRAKRGCATHPRSIAERVRRTKISERMRKLQELVPNMDKQTNTADMLDLAVDYIKDLQRQVKSLSDNRANCTCSPGKQKPYQ